MKELLEMIAKAFVNGGQEMSTVFICSLFDPGTPPTPPNPNPSEPLPGPSEPIPPDPQGNLVWWSSGRESFRLFILSALGNPENDGARLAALGQ